MGIYNESILIENSQYVVQDYGYFPKKYNYLIGNKVLLLRVDQSTASIRYAGNKIFIPTRSLISIPEYIAKSVSTKNADGFAVVTKNNLGIPVGTAYLNHKGYTDTHFKVMVDGKELTIPLDIVCSLIKEKKKEKPINSKKVNKLTGLPTELIEFTEEMIAPYENRKDIQEIPSTFSKMLPGVNLQELRDSIISDNIGCFDYHGDTGQIDAINFPNFYHRCRKTTDLKQWV